MKRSRFNAPFYNSCTRRERLNIVSELIKLQAKKIGFRTAVVGLLGTVILLINTILSAAPDRLFETPTPIPSPMPMPTSTPIPTPSPMPTSDSSDMWLGRSYNHPNKQIVHLRDRPDADAKSMSQHHFGTIFEIMYHVQGSGSREDAGFFKVKVSKLPDAWRNCKCGNTHNIGDEGYVMAYFVEAISTPSE
ncbi:MAG: hypothetical protein FWD25_11635 [Clostridia bacterium]|nr:hypothetical protein [Clostridia bacterium]